jgi:hypothetical protein
VGQEGAETGRALGDGVTGLASKAACGALRSAAIIGAVSALAGCGVSTLTSSFSGGIFGGGKTETTQNVSEGNLLTAAQNSTGAPAETGAVGSECPAVTVGTGDGNITFMAKGGSNDGLSVMHRGEITNTARECAPSLSGGLAVKFGFAGRVLLGPQGKPGTVTLPVKITVLDGGRATIKADQAKVPVTIAPDQTAGYFSVVREIVVPVPPGASAKGYKIIIAFDRRAPGAS